MPDKFHGAGPGRDHLLDIEARHAEVVGGGPRIAPLPEAEFDETMRDLVADVRRMAGADHITGIAEYPRTLLRHPDLYRAQMEMGRILFAGAIPAAERELAILRAAWIYGAPYIWGHHARIAPGAGLAEDEIARIRQGSDAPGWTPHQRAVLSGVEELLAGGAICDATWATLRETWDEVQLIEFPALVGQYVAVAFVQNAMRASLDAGSCGLHETGVSARETPASGTTG